jgi:DNA-binding IclR family transcriptional regulator
VKNRNRVKPQIANPGKPSIGKALAILYLFEWDRPEWTADEICVKTKGTRPSVYRYIRELVDVGLLRRIPGGRYALGPAIIRLDNVIRNSDPLLRAAAPVMHELTARTSCDCSLTALFGNSIMDMHSEHGDDSRREYGRGQPVEMFRGSAAKVILSQQPATWQRRLYQAHATEIATRGMGNDWATFAATLTAIRKSGYYISRGEVTPALSTIAVPISALEAGYSAALSVVCSSARFEILNHDLIIELLQEAVERIKMALELPSLMPASSSSRPSAVNGRTPQATAARATRSSAKR